MVPSSTRRDFPRGEGVQGRGKSGGASTRCGRAAYHRVSPGPPDHLPALGGRPGEVVHDRVDGLVHLLHPDVDAIAPHVRNLRQSADRTPFVAGSCITSPIGEGHRPAAIAQLPRDGEGALVSRIERTRSARMELEVDQTRTRESSKSERKNEAENNLEEEVKMG